MLLAASAAWSQETAPAGQLPDTVRAAPAAIPQTEVPRRAAEALARLASLRVRLVLDSSVLAIEADLPEFLAALPEAPSDSALAELSLLGIEPLLDTLVVRFDQLTVWQDRLEQRSGNIASTADSLRTLSALWRVSYDSAVAREAPEAVLQRERTVLATIDSVARQATASQSVILTLLDQVSVTGSQVGDAVTRMQAAVAAARTRLFEPDSPPLWKARAVGDSSLVAQFGASWRRRASTVRGFVTENWPRVAFHVVLFTILIAAVIALRRYMPAEGIEDQELRAPVYLLGRPVASAALLALLGSRLVYTNVPTPVVSVLVMAGLLVVVWLVRGLVEEEFRAPLYVLAALFLIERERLLAAEGTFLYRVLLLVATTAGLAAFIWFLRIQRRAGERTRLKAAVALGARIGAVLLGASLLANVAGLVTLADLLNGGVVWSAALALILATGVIIAHGGICVALRTRLARQLQVVRVHETGIITATGRFIRFVAVLWWGTIALRSFSMYEPFRSAIVEFLTRPRTLGSATLRIGDWVLFGVTIWAAVWLSRIVRYLLDEDVLPRLELRRGIAGLVSALARYTMLGLGVTVALAAAGIRLDRLAFIAGALGVGIGFGLQNIVSNFVSGLVLLFERPVQVGDTVEVGTLFGQIRRIGVRSSTVRTFQGADVIVPNANLITNEVVNWTLSDQLRRADVNVGVAYGNDPEQIREILLGVARAHRDVLDTPEPAALFVGFGESSLDFSLRCWTSEFSRFLTIRSELATAVYAALREAQIEVPFPQRDLHLRSVTREAQGALPAAES
jgi:small-conductance mechanosensitive channel